MKKTRSMLAVLLCVAMLASLSLVASADATCTKVESVLDFTAMPRMAEDVNKADTAAYVVGAGAVACENLMVAGNNENIANPGGYQGEGYFVQKVAAPAGETIQSAKLDLGYWVLTSDPQGYVKLSVSANGTDWTEVATDNQGAAARKEISLDLPFAAGQTELYVKLTMQHWNTYEGAGVAYSKVTINVLVPAAETGLESNLDFTKMPRMDENVSKADVAAYIINAGAVAAENLMVAGNNENIANPGGYQGEGYFVQKVAAPAGETIQSAKLDLGYWVLTSDPQGYVKLSVSANGTDWTEVATDNQGAAARKEISLDLPFTPGQTELYVKLTMQHWNTYEGAGVAYSKLSITAGGAPADPAPTDPALPEGTVQNVADFRTLSQFAGAGMPDESNEAACADAFAAAKAAMESLGLTIPDGSGPWVLQDCFHIFATPIHGYNECSLMQTLEAGEGKVFAEDVSLTAGYWLAKVNDPSWFWIEYSTDGEHWEEAYADEEGRGAEWDASAYAEGTISLPNTKGAEKVYVKFFVVRHSGQTSGGLTFSKLTAMTADAGSVTPPATEGEGTESPKTGDAIGVVVAMLAVSGLAITALKKKEN